MSRVLSFLTAAAVVGIVISSSAQAQLTHRYSFTTTLNDSVGTANGVSTGDTILSGGQVLVNLTDPARNGRVDLQSSGAGGININTYSATTIEFWATPNCDNAVDCAPNPNDSFSTAFSLGDVYPAGKPFPAGAGANYIIMQTHRGDNVSRGALSVTDEDNANGPWTAESGANGPELNDAAEHQYAIVIDATTLTWYVDGVPTGTTALATSNSQGLANTLAGVSTAHAWIGSGYAIDQNWAGAMNELRIFNKAGSDAYIANSFHAGPDQLTTFIEKTVPEPASVVLAVLGFFGLVTMAGRKLRG